MYVVRIDSKDGIVILKEIREKIGISVEDN